jgi:hypothetical protein
VDDRLEHRRRATIDREPAVNSPLVQNLVPPLIALGTAFLVLLVLLRTSPARLDLRRLLHLHRCQRGGVQSLAFVLVLPIFITVVAFIVQVSQLLIGMIVVQHASFAAARAASVWLPAHLDADYEPVNVIDTEFQPIEVVDTEENQFLMTTPVQAGSQSAKLRKIRAAAVMGCAAVSPSRTLGLASASREADEAAGVARRLYPRLVPSSNATASTDRRIVNKIAYSDANTLVVLEWRDTANNTVRSPTYNPRNHPHPDVVFDPYEVGWQDAVTVYVVHRYALSVGAGRVLAGQLSGWQRLPDHVLALLPADWTANTTSAGGMPMVLVTGTATITNEGLKPVRRHTVQP